MAKLFIALILIVVVDYIAASALEVVNGEDENELQASLEGSNREKRAFIVRSTSYTTSTISTTLSTAYVCYLKNYKCSGKRRRRNVIVEPLDNENAPVLEDVAPEVRDLVKRTADENLIHLHDLTHITFYPTKVQDRVERDTEEEEEEQVAVEEKKEGDDGRFLFNGVTIVQTATTSTTTTITETIGTIGITGTTSGCAGTSISEYFSKCG